MPWSRSRSVEAPEAAAMKLRRPSSSLFRRRVRSEHGHSLSNSSNNNHSNTSTRSRRQAPRTPNPMKSNHAAIPELTPSSDTSHEEEEEEEMEFFDKYRVSVLDVTQSEPRLVQTIPQLDEPDWLMMKPPPPPSSLRSKKVSFAGDKHNSNNQNSTIPNVLDTSLDDTARETLPAGNLTFLQSHHVATTSGASLNSVTPTVDTQSTDGCGGATHGCGAPWKPTATDAASTTTDQQSRASSKNPFSMAKELTNLVLDCSYMLRCVGAEATGTASPRDAESLVSSTQETTTTDWWGTKES